MYVYTKAQVNRYTAREGMYTPVSKQALDSRLNKTEHMEKEEMYDVTFAAIHTSFNSVLIFSQSTVPTAMVASLL